MYKVLLADDEALSRESMRKIIEEMGPFEVDVAADGREALQLIRGNAYDAILLDIMMPNYTGLEVLEQIKDIRPAPVKVVISGYDKFEYAQRAMQHGVNDYLVKPISSEQIEQLMRRLTKMMEQRRVLIESEKTIEDELERSREIMRERFLEKLTCSEVDREVLQEQLKYYGLSFPWPYFSVAMMYIANRDERYDEKQHISYELTLLKGLQGYSDSELSMYAFRTMGDRIGVLFHYKDLKKQLEIENILEELTQMLREYFNVQLIVGVSRMKGSIDLLHRAYQESLVAYRWCVVSDSQTAKFYSDIYGGADETPGSFDVDTLVAELSIGNADDILQRLDAIFAQEGKGGTGTFIAMNKIISACQMACRSSNVTCDSEVLSQAFAIMCMDYQKVTDSFRDVMERLVRSTCQNIAREHREKSGFYIEKAKKMIAKQIQSGAGEISVGMLANELGLSKNYFGKIFKASTGMSLSSYVNNLRIKQATELLRNTNMKIYEVGRAVGFENQHYFSVAFKQNVGVSPSEFRELI